ncbi:MAG: family 10 glycosylhydrolase [Cellulosilyticaceae bacterium]
MKKIISIMIISILIIGSVQMKPMAQNTNQDMRGVWISTVWNLDYPSANHKGDEEAQKEQYIEILDKIEEVGMNTVVVQVRPKSDAFYQSDINPWSDILTGTQGEYPGYDPMAFMIDEAHKRDIAFHAWLNPYRVMTGGTDVTTLAPNHPARLNPEWTITYNEGVYYNPALEEVQQHIVDTVAEIVRNYDIDAIHLDDYFYPSGYPLPEGEDRDGPTANSRREDINDMVRKVSSTIKSINPKVEFGMSPIGIWKNKKSDPEGSDTTGGEGYYSVCADAKTWIENEWIDYIVPQIYWEIGHAKADYATLVKWWSNLVKGTDVKLYIGQGIYKDEIASTIEKNLYENTKHSEIEGNIYFSLRDLLNNKQGVKDKLTTYYKTLDSDIEIPNTTTFYKEATAIENNVNVRKKPAMNSKVIKKLQLNESVDVIDYKDGWYHVRLSSNEYGYISSGLLKISDAIRLVINGEQMRTEVDPVMQNNTTLVPLRIISENLGAEVKWDGETKQITIKDKEQIISLMIGNNDVYVNGIKTTLNVAPTLINSTTLVPIRFISETIGAQVDWLKEEKIVKIIR